MVHSTSCPCVLVWFRRVEWTVGDSGRGDKTRCYLRKGLHIITEMGGVPCQLHVTIQQSSLKHHASQRDQHDKSVEIFIPQASQWHKASPAPLPLSNLTTTCIHDKCFLALYYSTKVYRLCVSVHLATTTTGCSVTPQVTTEWKDLPKLPYQCFVLGSLNGCLLAVGGACEERLTPISTVQCYSPITNTWKKVGNLPERDCHVCSTVLLPTGELLVKFW